MYNVHVLKICLWPVASLWPPTHSAGAEGP